MSSGDGVPLGGPPKKLTTPPLRTIATAHSQVAGVATASMTMSAPRESGVRAADGGDGIDLLADLYDYGFCAEEFGGGDLVVALDDGDDVDAGELEQTCMNIRPMGPAPMTTMVSPAWAPLSSSPRTTQARGSVRAACSSGMCGGNQQGVLFDDAGGDADVLGVSAVVEEEVFAEILLAVAAEEADVAGSGVEGDDAVAACEWRYSGPTSTTVPASFVAEGDGRLQHHGVVAAAIDLEIGAAGEGCADPDHQFAVRRPAGQGSAPSAGLPCRSSTAANIFREFHHLFYLLIPDGGQRI